MRPQGFPNLYNCWDLCLSSYQEFSLQGKMVKAIGHNLMVLLPKQDLVSHIYEFKIDCCREQHYEVHFHAIALCMKQILGDISLVYLGDFYRGEASTKATC